MPKTQHHAVEFSRAELSEISVALFDQIATYRTLDAGVYAPHIDRSRAALAKSLILVGQAAGDRCFLCRQHLVVESETRALYCPNGCESPTAHLRRLGHVR